MHKAFLSSIQLKDYLEMLTEDGLLQYDSDSRTFKATTKGLMVLEHYNQLDGTVKLEQKQQRKLRQQEVWVKRGILHLDEYTSTLSLILPNVIYEKSIVIND
ncbi:MAG: winged helix-turn-helix domain-containing protein [Thermoproteota archaeon]|nr:winged helix-turn-helix domain-containing protein [Thermoproteota archaeon]